ncbi:hypothetical protein Ae168Ps1_4898 [Pseudonocardia sp. Ae168_Ps1]|uniref:DUF1622 domain-containing protein n=1 Tax=unclassified Pseudonocardia TaxID=2619320 RepID=UPI00096069B8|nr:MULTISPECIES: DUF1622 domain-containing protein [unclassified Pseudonocardia]OLL76482.1 hypothetical protein Ae150APs1_4860 [Pseudonocardia sp. Ae150A_Ps1]OLL82492.1 hypothetical protein Ae168Ps1_4898 [Pseudonocardia sp. Ae168_Ps1]OLL83394.1 hypothetical protein Ae263Ps1_0449c [Pseudonocardia sp. Ae263_Ps1]OLL90568.1 hypothetical protein Ae356Ps1_0465 [Pseudonocardia sp. Ae356_Ps1]
MTVAEGMEHVATAFEVIGAAVLVLGLVLAGVLAVRVWQRTRSGRAGYRTLRETFGGVLLLGLEILVAADLVRTVAVESTLQSVAVLGLIVLIRTFLSFSLEIEIEGIPPWRRALVGGGRQLSAAVSRAGATASGPAGTGGDGRA